MKLHSPAFEQALRRGINRAVRSSPELKRERRLAKRQRRASRLAWLVYLAYLWFAGLAVYAAASKSGHVATGLAVINLLMLGSLHLLAQALWKRLHGSSDNAALVLLPIPRERWFRWQWQKFLRQSLLMLFVLLAGFGALAGLLVFPPWKWAAALLVALVAWAVVLALTAFCTARLIRGPLAAITSGLILVGFATLFGRQLVLPVVLRALDQAAPALNLFLPTGWPVSLFQPLAAGGPGWFLLLLVPVGVVLWTIRDSWQRLYDGFHYQEVILPEFADLAPEAAAGNLPADKPVQLGPTAIEEIIQSRTFLAPPAWPQRGRLELWLWRWFSPRERALAEFVFPNGYAITARWLRIVKVFAVMMAIALVAGLVSPVPQMWTLVIGMVITGFLTLGQMVNHGRAFHLLRFGGVNVPMHAGYGIGFTELSRLLTKCALLQLPLLLVFAPAAGVTAALIAGLPPVTGWVFGLKAGGLLFASRFIFATLAFSAGTNDTSRFRFRSILLLATIVLVALLFAGLGGCGLFLQQQPVAAWLCCLGAVLDAYALVWIYRWFQQHGRFDLMSVVRR
jgi:hypothetical protein